MEPAFFPKESDKARAVQRSLSAQPADRPSARWTVDRVGGPGHGWPGGTAGLCEKAGVPCQTFVNRSDLRGGTTIGPITAGKLNIPVIDMGAPVLSMHSIRELASVKDNEYTIKAFTEFFN